MFQTLVPRFIKYVKVNTRSDHTSKTVPSTESQVEFAHSLVKELNEIGMTDAVYTKETGFVTATLESNLDYSVPTIGFIAHMDTADFNADGVNPQIVENYDGSPIQLDKEGKYILDPKVFENLNNYVGQTLITTDGSTLLGADDKAGIAEIITAMEHLINNPEIPHGKIRVAFGPDEEIGTGANSFDVEHFNADFAYTIDGGQVGDLNYETFNAAGANITFLGQNVHPGTAKDLMVNSIKLAIDFNSRLPQNEAPEHTQGYEGFYHLQEFSGNEEKTVVSYIIRDHDKDIFNQRKQVIQKIADEMNSELDKPRVILELEDQYYNMSEVIKEDYSIITLAETAMKNLGIKPLIEPVRGGTDGSRISFMGLPTPNLFAGGENMHGRFEFVAVESMELATKTILEIIKLNAVE